MTKRGISRGKRWLYTVDVVMVLVGLVPLALVAASVSFLGQNTLVQCAALYFLVRVALAMLASSGSGRDDGEDLDPWDPLERGGPSP